MKPGLLKHWHSIFRLLMIITVIIVSTILFTAIFSLLSIPFIGLSEVAGMMQGDISISTLKLFQIITSVSMFVIPPFIIAYLFSRHPIKWLRFGKIEVKYAIAAALIFIAIQPLVSLVGFYNINLKLPESLAHIEQWMASAEEAAKMTMFSLLDSNSFGGILINIFMIAIIPAVGEELLFRAALQPTFKRLFRNHHAAVWVTAIIFSAVHMQFFTFLPRLILGVALGYTLVIGKRIWYPIIGHFVNNFLSLVVFYVMRYINPDENPLDSAVERPDLWLVFASLLLLAGLIGYFTNNLKWRKGYFSK